MSLFRFSLRGVTFSGAIFPPTGFVFLVDADGAYLVTSDGAFIVEAA